MYSSDIEGGIMDLPGKNRGWNARWRERCVKYNLLNVQRITPRSFYTRSHFPFFYLRKKTRHQISYFAAYFGRLGFG